jgi:hypothetical protein
MHDLRNRGTFAPGTVIHSRKGMPNSFKHVRLPKGDTLVKSQGSLTAVLYSDRRQVTLLTTVGSARITVPVAKVPLFPRSCIRFGLVNQLSIVTWWWSPKWGLIKSITIWYLETYFAISASDAYTSYLRNTIYVTNKPGRWTVYKRNVKVNTSFVMILVKGAGVIYKLFFARGYIHRVHILPKAV